MTVRQLLASADSYELEEWKAYFRLENQGQKEPEKPAKPDPKAWFQANFGHKLKRAG